MNKKLDEELRKVESFQWWDNFSFLYHFIALLVTTILHPVKRIKWYKKEELSYNLIDFILSYHKVTDDSILKKCGIRGKEGHEE